MFEPVHLQYVLTAPHFGGNTCSQLFDLMDKLDSAARNQLLEPLYLGYEISFDQKGTLKQIRTKRYQEFKKVFLLDSPTLMQEQYVVFGLVSFVLAEALRKSDVARFERIIDDLRMLMGSLQQEAVKEVKPAGQIWQEIRELTDQIESLHKEVEESRRAYRMFCSQVAAPLLARGN
jgi:hypothetical protein